LIQKHTAHEIKISEILVDIYWFPKQWGAEGHPNHYNVYGNN